MTKPGDITLDVPRFLLKDSLNRKIRAGIISNSRGILAGIEDMENQALALGLEVNINSKTGDEVFPGEQIASFLGDPMQIIRGEDSLLGIISKVSGIATAARQAITSAGKVQVVSGGWKKVPPGMKEYVRKGLIAGGVFIRMLPEPFVYLDKNYLRILGSLETEINIGHTLPGRSIVVQLRGETAAIDDEACHAAQLGAKVVMIDTGSIEDLRKCAMALRAEGLREKVKLAFGGGVKLEELPHFQAEDLEFVDIGRAILDAPMLDFRYDVI
ncbi:nicotinate-nucleotide pyrophosphorylase [Desulfosporosinus sp. PR]|uniref:nicotinate-nucleotide pyrophosphorylase n=1 Tax=Candidatus Desulfosporosinus nitrosoreducens TaxID=3401928 RepID=UPI0027F72E29|nr:nicotinate-nucleotide pyrophosphorylase [Desulfosporosinus sp. PR]MDQ7095426.1 nicotinate-nucleotide pyrophosphorylase [Desulfosporosinus sp. PR]